MITAKIILLMASRAACVAWGEVRISVTPDGANDRTACVREAVWQVAAAGGGVVSLASGDYHFHSGAAERMRFHVSNHDQPEVRPVFLPFVGVTNVAVVAEGGARFVMHGMGTAILLRGTKGVSFKGITVEWEKPFFAQSEIVGVEGGKTRVRFSPRDRVVPEDGKVVLCGEDWKDALQYGTVFDRTTHDE